MGKCQVCKGLGTTKRRSSEPCDKCSSGVCAGCGGSRTSSLTVPCLPCQGKGRCSRCRGTGQGAPPVEQPCSTCHASGITSIACGSCSKGATYAKDNLVLHHTIANRFNPSVNVRTVLCSNDGGRWQGYLDDSSGTRWPQEISKMYIIEDAGVIRGVGMDAKGPYSLQGTIEEYGRVVTLERKRAHQKDKGGLKEEAETWVGKFSEYLGTRCILGTIRSSSSTATADADPSKQPCFLLYNGLPCTMSLPGCTRMAHYYDQATQIFACPTCATCEDCQGSTRRPLSCTFCHGTGTLTLTTPCPTCVDASFKEGKVGTGICAECLGKGSLDARKPCQQCGRKGRCLFCKGYTVIDHWADEMCAECEGTGDDTTQKDGLRSAILKVTNDNLAPRISFGPKNTLNPESLPTLEKIAMALRQYKHVAVEIEILTDSVGPRAEQTCLAQGQIIIARLVEWGPFKANRFVIRPKFSSPFRDIQFHPISTST